MKRLVFFIVSITVFLSCTNDAKKESPIIKWTDNIVKTYPNYNSNELAKKSVMDSVVNLAVIQTGKEASFLKGIHFSFKKMIENKEDKDSFAVFFTSTNCRSHIEAEGVGRKYIITDIILRVIGKVGKESAAKLDSNQEYFIKGIVYNWDAGDLLNISSHYSSEEIDFGTYILNSSIEIEAVPQIE